jgi:DNA repair exonuclease SbcCD ATPase subunit
MAISRLIFCCAIGTAVFNEGYASMAVAQENRDKLEVEADFEELAKSFEKFASSLEKEIEQSAEKYGKEIESWAEQFGREMETWAEENAGEWEAWANQNAGKMEGMAKELEQRLAGLEQKLKLEIEESGLREKVEKAVSDLVKASADSGRTVDEIRKELESAGRSDKKRAEELQQELMGRLKEEKRRIERSKQELDREGDTESRHKYLEKRIDEIRGVLKQEIPQQKRAVLERALAQLTDLKSATVDEERIVERIRKAPAEAAGRAEQGQRPWLMKEKQLETMLANEQKRHESNMARIKTELEAVKRQAQRAAQEQEKLRKTEVEAKAGKDREQAELEELRNEVRRLKKELESIKK